MIQTQAVALTGLGKFTFKTTTTDLGTKGVIERRTPVFLVSENFARLYNLKIPKPFVTNQIPVLEVNYFLIAQKASTTKEVVASVLKHLYLRMGEVMSTGKGVSINFNRVGKFISDRKIVDFVFTSKYACSFDYRNGEFVGTSASSPSPSASAAAAAASSSNPFANSNSSSNGGNKSPSASPTPHQRYHSASPTRSLRKSSATATASTEFQRPNSALSSIKTVGSTIFANDPSTSAAAIERNVAASEAASQQQQQNLEKFLSKTEGLLGPPFMKSAEKGKKHSADSVSEEDMARTNEELIRSREERTRKEKDRERAQDDRSILEAQLFMLDDQLRTLDKKQENKSIESENLSAERRSLASRDGRGDQQQQQQQQQYWPFKTELEVSSEEKNRNAKYKKELDQQLQIRNSFKQDKYGEVKSRAANIDKEFAEIEEYLSSKGMSPVLSPATPVHNGDLNNSFGSYNNNNNLNDSGSSVGSGGNRSPKRNPFSSLSAGIDQPPSALRRPNPKSLEMATIEAFSRYEENLKQKREFDKLSAMEEEAQVHLNKEVDQVLAMQRKRRDLETADFLKRQMIENEARKRQEKDYLSMPSKDILPTISTQVIKDRKMEEMEELSKKKTMKSALDMQVEEKNKIKAKQRISELEHDWKILESTEKE